MHPLELQRKPMGESWAASDQAQDNKPACLPWAAIGGRHSLCCLNCCLLLLEMLNLWLCLYRKLVPEEERDCHKPEICVIDSEGGLAESEIQAICAHKGLLGATEYCFHSLTKCTGARKSQVNSAGEVWRRII